MDLGEHEGIQARKEGWQLAAWREATRAKGRFDIPAKPGLVFRDDLDWEATGFSTDDLVWEATGLDAPDVRAQFPEHKVWRGRPGWDWDHQSDAEALFAVTRRLRRMAVEGQIDGKPIEPDGAVARELRATAKHLHKRAYEINRDRSEDEARARRAAFANALATRP